MKKNKFNSLWVDIVVLLGIVIAVLVGAYIYGTSTKYPKHPASIWHEGDQVVFKNNGPRMLVIRTEDNSFVVCKYYNYVQGNFITTSFDDNQLEKVENENNK